MIVNILNKICSDCKSYTRPKVHFDRTLTGDPAQKLDENGVRDAVDNGNHIGFPIYEQVEKTEFAGNYPYVLIAETQGSAMIIVNEKTRTLGVANVLLSTAALWTVVLIMFFLVVLCGIALWLIVSKLYYFLFTYYLL